MKKLFTPRMLTFGAALVAINVILTKFLSITLTFVRIGFNFLPISLGAMLFGPVSGGILALVADVLGVIIVGEPLFWGYSVSAFLYGLTYGLFLYKKDKSYKRIALCVILQTIFIDILLGAYWGNLFFGKPYFVALIGRAADAVPMAVIKIYAIKYLWKYTEKSLTNLIKG
ncbi:MAG: folate family ECF transporter S component [Clostridia bacterium]|nr:folate family ECF transporter S component [Clostridia bacterium]